jgi:hypothetical protein
MAKWKIKDGSRAHCVLGVLHVGRRYHEAWTLATCRKLIAHGLAEIAEAPLHWGWGKANQIRITDAGRVAYEGAIGGAVLVPAVQTKEP